MSIVTDILSNVASTATGGIAGIASGLFGSLTHGIVSIWSAKIQASHEQDMGELNLKLIAAQTSAAQALNADQLKVLTLQGQDAAFIASQQAGAIMPGSNPTIAAINQMYRPFLCTTLLVLEYSFWGSYTPELRQFIIISNVALTSMAVSWWWGNRQLEKFLPSKPSA